MVIRSDKMGQSWLLPTDISEQTGQSGVSTKDAAPTAGTGGNRCRVVFEKTVTFAKALGILTLGHLSTDGTRTKANASNDYTLSKEEIEEIREIIERGIAIDEEEDKLYGDNRRQ